MNTTGLVFYNELLRLKVDELSRPTWRDFLALLWGVR